MKHKIALFLFGAFVGAALFSNVAYAAVQITAARSNCAVFIDGQRVELTAYMINSENYVRLRDIGAKVGFNVYWERALFLDNLRGNTQ